MLQHAVTVYCASSPDAPPRFMEAAYTIGRLCAGAGLATVTGAGATGLMGEVVRGTLDVPGGCAVGVIPSFMVERGWANPAMTRLTVTSDMYERKRLLAESGSAAIALPGGLGTLDELFDILTRCQLGLYRHPVVILNVDGFYDSLLAQLRHADSCSMMRHMGLPGNLWREAADPRQAVAIVTDYISRYDDLCS